MHLAGKTARADATGWDDDAYGERRGAVSLSNGMASPRPDPFWFGTLAATATCSGPGLLRDARVRVEPAMLPGWAVGR